MGTECNCICRSMRGDNHETGCKAAAPGTRPKLADGSEREHQIIIDTASELDARGLIVAPENMTAAKDAIETWIRSELEDHLHDMLDECGVKYLSADEEPECEHAYNVDASGAGVCMFCGADQFKAEKPLPPYRDATPEEIQDQAYLYEDGFLKLLAVDAPESGYGVIYFTQDNDGSFSCVIERDSISSENVDDVLKFIQESM